MLMRARARTASRRELGESPSVSARSASRGSRSPGLSWPPRIISLIRRMASSVRAMARLLRSSGTVDRIIGGGRRAAEHAGAFLGGEPHDGVPDGFPPEPIAGDLGQDRPVAAEHAAAGSEGV